MVSRAGPAARLSGRVGGGLDGKFRDSCVLVTGLDQSGRHK